MSTAIERTEALVCLENETLYLDGWFFEVVEAFGVVRCERSYNSSWLDGVDVLRESRSHKDSGRFGVLFVGRGFLVGVVFL